ncbi:uncharacterized protein NPIL_99991 [Nephila pilipes]|uniref:DUF7041 domain-containing protein n=1 Tax=Nephila pilipes TaxID=299642 RepID=A0A8X6TMP3_NEPPI|nr:uncharacterized protein NPIL_99991 [Nephila pilipes]
MEEVLVIEIPALIPTDPSLLFIMLESTFELALLKTITTSRTKYNHCVASLPSEIALTVRDIIILPDKTDPYALLRGKLFPDMGKAKLEKFADSWWENNSMIKSPRSF